MKWKISKGKLKAQIYRGANKIMVKKRRKEVYKTLGFISGAFDNGYDSNFYQREPAWHFPDENALKPMFNYFSHRFTVKMNIKQMFTNPLSNLQDTWIFTYIVEF